MKMTMEEKDGLIDDQPLPPTDEQEQIAATNARMGVVVQDLGNALVQKFRDSGNQFNVLDIELKVLMLIENVQMLGALVIELSQGKFTDQSITETMTARVEKLVKSMEAPSRIQVVGGALPKSMNGSKHN